MQRYKYFILSVIFIILAQAAHAATITGTVNYQGPVPAFKPMATSADPACPTDVYPDVVVVGNGNELANVLVYISEGVPEGHYPVPDKPVVLNQIGCRYEPHVFAAMIGQQVIFTSSDPTLHTVDVHAQNNQKFAVEMPKGDRGGAKFFSKEEFMIPIMCSVHPWMLAFANILRHPYFFVSETNGRYLIKQLPPGAYTLEAWHEKLGRQTKSITIDNNDETKWVDFTFLVP